MKRYRHQVPGTLWRVRCAPNGVFVFLLRLLQILLATVPSGGQEIIASVGNCCAPEERE